MGEFFKGWRRKAGLVAIAMACVFGAECIGHIHDGSWEMICPGDWSFLRCLAILPLMLLSARLIVWKPKRIKNRRDESGL